MRENKERYKKQKYDDKINESVGDAEIIRNSTYDSKEFKEVEDRIKELKKRASKNLKKSLTM